MVAFLMRTPLIVRLGLALSGIILSAFLCETILNKLNFPAEEFSGISYPPFYKQRIRNLEYEYMLETNRRGLRYRDIDEKSTHADYRVFVVGDSFTEGVGVDADCRFTDLLEKRIESGGATVQFINGGISGSGPDKYYRLFQNIGLEYKPNALLICVYMNDVANTREMMDSVTLDSRFDRRGLYRVCHGLWPRFYTLLSVVKSNIEYRNRNRKNGYFERVTEAAAIRDISDEVVDAWKERLPMKLVRAVEQRRFNGAILSYGLLYPDYWKESIDISSARAERKYGVMIHIFDNLIDLCDRQNIETAVVLIPSRFLYDSSSYDARNVWIIGGTHVDKRWLTMTTEIQERLRFWADSRGLPFIDLTPAFRDAVGSGDRLCWELDGHWTNVGHEVAADAIYSWIVEQSVFPVFRDTISASR